MNKPNFFPSVKDLRTIFWYEDIYDAKIENREIAIFLSEKEREIIYIEIQSKIIGNYQVNTLLNIYKWLKSKQINISTIIINLSPELEVFASYFISICYLFNKGLNCKIILYSAYQNNRTFELAQMLHSASFSPDYNEFFNLATYDVQQLHTPPMIWKNWKNPSITSLPHKNLPLITINKVNFHFYFQTYISELLIEVEKDPLIISPLKQRIFSYYEKLQNNIHCKKEDIIPKNSYQYYIWTQLEEKINNLTFFQLLLLSLLTDPESCNRIRTNYIKIYQQFTQDHTTKPQNKTLIKINKKYQDKQQNIYEAYLIYLEREIEYVCQIEKGIYELVKNTVEHSSNHRGVLTVKLISESNLLEINNENNELWKKFTCNILSESWDNPDQKTFFDISIIDDGTEGIIETSLKNIHTNWRDIPDKEKQEDRRIIENKLQMCNNEEDQSKLMYQMYFDYKMYLLTRQTNQALQSLGISIFTRFIDQHKGIFNIRTNKYRDNNKTIGYSSLTNKPELSSAPFGTAYNIVLPLLSPPVTSFLPVVKDTKEKLQAPPRVVFEKMLLYKRKEGRKKYYDPYSIPIQTTYIIENIKTGEEEIMVFILSTTSLIDRSNFYRMINTIFMNSNIKSFIIENAQIDLIRGVNELFQYSASNELIQENRSLLFITEDNRHFILTGTSQEECLKINSLIEEESNHIKMIRELLHQTNTTLLQKEELNQRLIQTPLFADNFQLILTDVFEEDKTTGLTLYEKEVKTKLERSIDSDEIGYNWKDTHLKIGSKLHLRDFIYGKKLFQRNKDASKFAYFLALDIFKNIRNQSSEPDTFYTLIGYGYYSELLVSRTKDFLSKLFNEFGIDSIVEYMIVSDEEVIKFSRYFQNLKIRKEKKGKTHEKLIIVVPLSSTLTTCLKIENHFYNELKTREKEVSKEGDKMKTINHEFQFVYPFYTLIIVGDDIDQENLPENFSDNKGINGFSPDYNLVSQFWLGKVKDKRIIKTYNREKEKERENAYRIYIKSKWQEPSSCIYCFPDIHPGEHNHLLAERPLFVTDKVAVTPSLIFNSPSLGPLQERVENDRVYFKFKNDDKDSQQPYISDAMVDSVHYKGTHKHFNTYIHYNVFIEANNEEIKKWAREIGEDKEKYEIAKKHVLLIAPDKSENGDFIHLINRYVFQDKANIIKVDATGDYYMNFDTFFKYDMDEAGLIFYIDNLMASSQSFLALCDVIQNQQNESRIEKSQGPVRRKTIDGIFCLINRMDNESYNNVINRLSLQSRLWAFVNLHVPVVSSPHIYCPMCEEKDNYHKLAQTTSLDALKLYYLHKEYPYYKIIKKEELTEKKLPTYNKKKSESSLLKLALTHFFYKAFYNDEECIQPLKQKENNLVQSNISFDDFTDQIRNYIISLEQCNMEKEIINDLKLKSNIIKVLISFPFKRHRGITIAVFHWILEDIIIASNTIIKKDVDLPLKQQTNIFTLLNNEIDEVNQDAYLDTLNYYRLLIKYGASLGINYLIHEDLLMAVNILCNRFIKMSIPTQNLFYNSFSEKKYPIVNFKIFVAAHIMRSVRKNESKSIQFQKNIDQVLLNSKSKSMDVSFLEILMLENTGIISQTLKNIKEPKEINEIRKKNKKKDNRLLHYYAFTSSEKVQELQNTLRLRNVLNVINHSPGKSQVKTSKKNNTEEFEIVRNTENIIEKLGKIISYNLETGGGFLLYKHQQFENNEEDLDYNDKILVIAKYGGDDLLADKMNTHINDNSIALKVLKGMEYLKEEEIVYTWSNYTVYKKGKKWYGQDLIEHTGAMETAILNETASRILFLRISCFNKKNKLEGNAVFVIYDDTPYREERDDFSIRQIRYVYTLRNQISEYFRKNFDNDSFRAWIQQENKNNYIVSLNHGIEVYDNAVNHYMNEMKEKLGDDGTLKYLEFTIHHLKRKIYLMHIASTIGSYKEDSSAYESWTIKRMVKKFEEDYPYIFSFHNSFSKYQKLKENNKVIYCNKIKKDYLMDEFNYPEGLMPEIIFELLYNIRKHVINDLYYKVEKEPLIFELDILGNKKNKLILSLTNNHYYTKDSDDVETNKQLFRNKKRGLNLINNILKKADLGNIEVKTNNKLFTILIPLT